MNDPAAAPTYHVLGPLGDDTGPYTVDDLRGRLISGRLRLEDRLRDHATGAPVDLLTVIPDAATLAAEAHQHAGDRIRRRTSERRAAVEAAAAEAAAAAPPVEAPAPEAAPPPPKGLPRAARIAIAVAVGLSALLLWDQYSSPRAPAITMKDLQGSWAFDDSGLDMYLATLPSAEAKTAMQPAVQQLRQRLHGLQFTIRDKRISITLNGSTTDHTLSLYAQEDRVLAFQLSPTHPQLGPEFALIAPTGRLELRLTTSDLSAPLRIQEP